MLDSLNSEYITAEAAKLLYGRSFGELMSASEHGLISRIQRDPDRHGNVTYVFRRADIVNLDAEEHDGIG